MASSPPESNPAVYFGFKDLHGFKDFLTEVIYGAPSDFMEMDWLESEDQMDLDRAFIGLRYGLDIIEKEINNCDLVNSFRKLVDEAYESYKSGREIEGQHKLEKFDKILSGISSH